MGHASANDERLENRQSEPPAESDSRSAVDTTDLSSRPAIPRELPVLPVRGVVVFPGTVVPLTVAREKSKRLIDSVLAGDKLVGVFAQRREDTEDPGIDDVYRVGTVVQILKLLRMPDGSSTLMVHGIGRAGLEQFVTTEPYWTALINPHRDSSMHTLQLEALAYNARQTAEKVLELSPNVPEEARQILDSIDDAAGLADFLAANLSLGLVQKQELLETFDVEERLRKVNATLQNQLEVLQLAKKLNTDVRKEIDKSQREYYLHEQMKAIRKELGEDRGEEELRDVRKRVEEAGMPEAVLAEAQRELARLERLPAASPETGVVRDYLEWLIELPWDKHTDDQLDLVRAEQVLNEDHYGLDKIKRRILEYLAVRKLNPEGHGPILCFAGPPGVGKTSLGHSIARALGRKFIRIALGGVRDEADIRGHRRTYIGAIPGRIIQEIRKAGVNNPVVMLDEMDKIGTDFRGDPAAALLEVLDPAQNHSFTDHYLGVPFDLSKTLFIGTANYMDPVEPALKDRMEVIDLPGYTTQEKLQIAKRYLVPRQARQAGVEKAGVEFSDAALTRIIENYTREAGVRNLEREVGGVCRALAARVARGDSIDSAVTPKAVLEILGPAPFERDIAEVEFPPGVVTGLAYTPVGGEIIFVEATGMPGRGSFQITGQIGDVMRESASTALSLLRSRAATWGIDLTRLGEIDIHIHVPAGAVPKDGPSAGVAMLTALYTLFTDSAADPTVGMTGEITLRGLVLPIGGVKEKVLAAHRAGLKTIILPARNEADLHEVPPEVRSELQFVFARRVEEVLLSAVRGEKRIELPKSFWKSAKRGTSGEQARRGAAKKKTAPVRGKVRGAR